MTDPHHQQQVEFDEDAPHRRERPCDDFVRAALLTKIVDGDTMRVAVDLGWGITTVQNIRLTGVNTPENRGPERPAGTYVTQLVHKWFDGRKDVVIHSRTFSLGKYGRCLCEVWAGNENLNDWLLLANLAWVTDSRGSMAGTRDIDTLTGIPEDIRSQVKAAA